MNTATLGLKRARKAASAQGIGIVRSPAMLESVIQLQIIHYLKAHGHIVGKTKTMGVKRGRAFCFDPYTFRGFSDLVAFVNNKICFIEVKSATGKQSYDQIVFQKLVEDAGLTYILARSVEDVAQKVLTELTQKI